MYYLIFHAVPAANNPESQSVGGAFISCWIDHPTFEEAHAVAQRLIADSQWLIEELNEAGPIDRSAYASDPTGLEHYEQALLDKEVLVFHCYPREDEGSGAA